jgi:2-(1,2-epoxy-1,2-dihydrophenyl)acetyl-CoA isomerase
MLGYVEDGKDPATYFRKPLSAFGEMVLVIRNCPKPVIAAVHGAVAGVAFNVMLACDLILAESKTKFTQAFIKIGLSPDGGGTWFLTRMLGYHRASELAMLPTEIDAETALKLGLINWIASADTFEARLKEIRTQLINSPAQAIANAKMLLNQAYERPLAEHIEAERLAQVENAFHPDFKEGLTAFLTKRTPNYRSK